jgi:OOP family OmpA-OmpF porin
MFRKVLLASTLATALFASDYTSEITATVGGNYYEANAMKHSLAYGLRYGVNTDSVVDQVELMVERAESKTKTTGVDNDLTRFGINGIFDMSDDNRLKPYFLVGMGYENVDNEIANYAEDSIYANYGVGIKYKLSENLNLKAEVRHLYKFDNNDNELVYAVGISIPFGKKAQNVEPTPEPVVVPKPKPVVEPTPEPVVVPKAPVDSDGDGVIDELDKCPDTPHGFKVDQEGCEVKFNFSANFDTNKANIKHEFIPNIEKFAEFLETSAYDVEIQGHTDSRGSEKYNQALSQKRADAISTYLINLGIDANRVKSVGYGESNPIATNDTAEGRYQNRRVVAVLKR